LIKKNKKQATTAPAAQVEQGTSHPPAAS